MVGVEGTGLWLVRVCAFVEVSRKCFVMNKQADEGELDVEFWRSRGRRLKCIDGIEEVELNREIVSFRPGTQLKRILSNNFSGGGR